MSRGSAWAARRDGAFTSVEDPQQRRLAEWMDQDKQARRRAEFGIRIAAIAAQVASEVSVAVASEVSAAVAAALLAARAGRHEYLDLATTSTPTVSMADDNPSVPDASIVVSTQRSTSASAQATTFSLPGGRPCVRCNDQSVPSPCWCQRPLPPQHQLRPRLPSTPSPNPAFLISSHSSSLSQRHPSVRQKV